MCGRTYRDKLGTWRIKRQDKCGTFWGHWRTEGTHLGQFEDSEDNWGHMADVLSLSGSPSGLPWMTLKEENMITNKLRKQDRMKDKDTRDMSWHFRHSATVSKAIHFFVFEFIFLNYLFLFKKYFLGKFSDYFLDLFPVTNSLKTTSPSEITRVSFLNSRTFRL